MNAADWTFQQFAGVAVEHVNALVHGDGIGDLPAGACIRETTFGPKNQRAFAALALRRCLLGGHVQVSFTGCASGKIGLWLNDDIA